MAYERQHFEDGQLLTAAQMNYIEDGIVRLEADGSTLIVTVDPDTGETNYGPNEIVEHILRGGDAFLADGTYYYAYIGGNKTDEATFVRLNGNTFVYYVITNERLCVGPMDIKSGSSAVRLSGVTVLASAWRTDAATENLHSQVVTIDGITEYSKVDLLPSVEQLAIFHNKDVAFVTENEDGVVTVYAIGDKPLQDYTMQVQITEVNA